VASHYLDRSVTSGAWSFRFALLARRLRGRPEEVVLSALQKLIEQEQPDVDEHWVRETARRISEGQTLSGS
jgi:hypothetical protein